MTTVEIATIAQPIVAALAAIGQIAVVAWGIRAMIAANRDRAAAAAKAVQRADERNEKAARRADERHEEAARRADERHKEAMAAHKTQAEADDKRHAEVMAVLKAQTEADDKRHAEAMAALDVQRRAFETQSKALETLIERTAPGASDR